MQIHRLQQAGAAQSVSRPASTKAASPVQSASNVNSRSADQLDLSSEAEQIMQTRESSPAAASGGIRTEKVAAIRQAIADGTYETPENLSAALDRLLDTFA